MSHPLSGHGPRALAVGIGATGACALGAIMSPDQFFRSYLFAYIFWLGVSLGCLAILMIQHVSGGAWGLVIRRLLESGTRTIPFMALMFVPLIGGLRSLYPWARPEAVAADALLQHKQPYLNVTFMLIRAAVYFGIWMLLAFLLNRWSRAQDETRDETLPRRLQLLSSGGLILFVLTMTFASVDWVMSLEPQWFSTIYGALLMAGQVVSAFCVIIAVAILLARSKPLSDVVTPAILHDLGKLLFTFVMIWAYFALSQFLIIWSGNLPEEIPWYLRRMNGGWEWVGLSIILLHFSLPFVLLLMRSVKRNAGRLVRVAMLILVMKLVDLYWMMAPASGGVLGVHWMDLAAVLGLGGLWTWAFLRQLGRTPLLPFGDPYLKEAMEHAGE